MRVCPLIQVWAYGFPIPAHEKCHFKVTCFFREVTILVRALFTPSLLGLGLGLGLGLKVDGAATAQLCVFRLYRHLWDVFRIFRLSVLPAFRIYRQF